MKRTRSAEDLAAAAVHEAGHAAVAWFERWPFSKVTIVRSRGADGALSLGALASSATSDSNDLRRRCRILLAGGIAEAIAFPDRDPSMWGSCRDQIAVGRYTEDFYGERRAVSVREKLIEDTIARVEILWPGIVAIVALCAEKRTVMRAEVSKAMKDALPSRRELRTKLKDTPGRPPR